MDMSLEHTARNNMTSRFIKNPSRGLVLGLDTEMCPVILYWIMGRSSGSKNRVIAYDNETDTAKIELAKSSDADTSLILYNAIREIYGNEYVVSNGDQTDTIIEALESRALCDGNGFISNEILPDIFFNALRERYCEPDGPIFTPRISGFIHGLDDVAYLSLLRADPHQKNRWITAMKKCGKTVDDFKGDGVSDAEAVKAFRDFVDRYSDRGEGDQLYHNDFPTIRSTFELPLHPGFGYCLTTYKPLRPKELPSFDGEPFALPIEGKSMREIMLPFWGGLESEWRVSMIGKRIIDEDESEIAIINKYGTSTIDVCTR